MAGVAGLLAGVQPALLALPILFAVPFVIWKAMHRAVYLLLASATVIEQLPYAVGSHKGVFTASIPWWRTFTHGMILFPVEIFLAIVLLVWAVKAGADRSFGLPRSPTFTMLKIFWGFIFLGVGVGLSHGAKLKFDLWEIRSWLYLTLALLLAAAFLRTRRSIETLLWVFVLGSGFKGVQGTIVFFSYARAMHPRPEAILGHEEAFFFGLFCVITCCLWLYGIRGALRRVATVLLPFVVVANLANARRAAWLILGLSILTVSVIAVATLPHRRKFLIRALVLFAIGLTFYLPAYWNHNGSLAQPARAIRSEFSPDQRDMASNLYRQQEDFNLISGIKTSGLLGTGFGIPIVYTDITNISNIDPMIDFIPHNGLLWIWLRIGMQGEIAFWCLVAVTLARACALARAPDRRMALFGTVVAAAIVAYIVDGYVDMGLAEFRIAVAMGCLIGGMEAASRLTAPDMVASGGAARLRRFPHSGSLHAGR